MDLPGLCAACRDCTHRRSITAYLFILYSVTIAILAAAPGALCAVQAGWQEERRLTNNEATSFTAPNNCKWLAVDPNGILHVVWLDERDRNFEIYHKMRVGGIWLDDERVTNNPGYSARPNLAVDGEGWLHLVWNDNRDGNMEIYHNVWTGVWNTEERVTNTSGDSFGSSIVADDDTLHMVYMEEVSSHLQVMYRTYRNNVWSAAMPLTNVPTGNRMVPTIAIGPDKSLHVAWWDTRGDTLVGKIYYRKKAGGVWLDEELLTNPAMNAMRPDIAVDDSGFVHVAWIDARGSSEEIYYRRRGPAGWEPEIALTNEPVTHYHPSIAAAGGEAFIAYWQEISETNSEIMFKRRVAGSWTASVQISNGAGTSELPCLIAEPNGNLHLAWVDSRDGNQEIYYREYIDPQNGTGGGGDEPLPTPPVPLLLTSSPNPFRGSTTIELSVSERCPSSIVIYDVNGRCVRKLFSRTLARGAHTFTWDGTDDAGRTKAAGIYFAVGRAGKSRIERKIVLVR